MADSSDWQFTPEQIGAFLDWLNHNPLRAWRARAWFIATVTAWLSFTAALWGAFLWPDLRTLAFAGVWLFVVVVLALAVAAVAAGPVRKGDDGE